MLFRKQPNWVGIKLENQSYVYLIKRLFVKYKLKLSVLTIFRWIPSWLYKRSGFIVGYEVLGIVLRGVWWALFLVFLLDFRIFVLFVLIKYCKIGLREISLLSLLFLYVLKVTNL